IQRCSACGTYIHLPRPVCRACRSFDLAPTEVSGRGTVYSFTETYKAFHPFFVDRVPFLLATVELEEQTGLMLLSNLVGATEPDMAVGAGACETAIAFRLMMQQPSSAAAAAGSAAIAVTNVDDTEFQFPFGDFSPTQWAGLLMNRYLHDTDATEEHFAQFAVTQREHAMGNDEA